MSNVNLNNKKSWSEKFKTSNQNFKVAFLSSTKNLIKFDLNNFSWEFLSSNVLRWIAVFTMFIDHAGLIARPSEVWFRIVGRLAFPIFAFLAGVGVNFSNRKLYYVLRFLVIGVIIQLFIIIFYFTVNRNTGLGPFYFNIMFTLFFGTLVGYVHYKNNIAGFALALILLVPFLLIDFLNTSVIVNNNLLNITIDYSTYGYLLILASYFSFYYAKKLNSKNWFIFFKVAFIALFLIISVLFIGFLQTMGNTQWYALFTIPLFLVYSKIKPYKNMVLNIWFLSAYALSFIIPALTVFSF
ncbi:hypothetical protein CJJ23_02570 [Mycoplasmopsis agassizii]|uniref:TraX protein n=1 Tax=Mycoplasmopsis agassizii TaxID=33922 RepID=A0A269TK42_9BACT|nr:TraX family protein [Mycoplasmopsis agassizii]PAK21298.1 hypothetical protein CJJ23_02570 [Mycoplasmopsis agassizii]